jgi:hypothetical protein
MDLGPLDFVMLDVYYDTVCTGLFFLTLVNF